MGMNLSRLVLFLTAYIVASLDAFLQFEIDRSIPSRDHERSARYYGSGMASPSSDAVKIFENPLPSMDPNIPQNSALTTSVPSITLQEPGALNQPSGKCRPDIFPTIQFQGFCARIDQLEVLCEDREVSPAKKDCAHVDGQFCCYFSTKQGNFLLNEGDPDLLPPTTTTPFPPVNFPVGSMSSHLDPQIVPPGMIKVPFPNDVGRPAIPDPIPSLVVINDQPEKPTASVDHQPINVIPASRPSPQSPAQTPSQPPPQPLLPPPPPVAPPSQLQLSPVKITLPVVPVQVPVEQPAPAPPPPTQPPLPPPQPVVAPPAPAPPANVLNTLCANVNDCPDAGTTCFHGQCSCWLQQGFSAAMTWSCSDDGKCRALFPGHICRPSQLCQTLTGSTGYCQPEGAIR